jgi:hypothetical protein
VAAEEEETGGRAGGGTELVAWWEVGTELEAMWTSAV